MRLRGRGGRMEREGISGCDCLGLGGEFFFSDGEFRAIEKEVFGNEDHFDGGGPVISFSGIFFFFVCFSFRRG